MIDPIFASTDKHSTKQSALTSLEALGQTVLSVDDTSLFTAGEPIFISDADDTDVQGLSVLSSKDGSTLTVEVALDKEYASGANIWTPNDFIVIDESYSYPEPDNSIILPEVFNMTYSGIYYAETLGANTKMFVLPFEYISQTLYDDFVDWYQNIVEGFTTSFYYIDPNEDTFEVRLMLNDGFKSWTNVAERYSGKLTLVQEPSE